jgi:hypothetical protein
MKTVYIADDGKQFDDICECDIYEWMLKHPHFKEIKFLDDDKEIDDLFSYKTNMNKIIVISNEHLATLREYADYIGIYSIKKINEQGTWIYDSWSDNWDKYK